MSPDSSFVFFFSSRRRHTRCSRDWSSDVCSSDLLYAATLNPTIGACVNFYGIHPNVKPDYSKLSGPVLGLFAEKDGFVTPQVAKETDAAIKKAGKRSEEHTSELQSRLHLVCRLLLEKKKKTRHQLNL